MSFQTLTDSSLRRRTFSTVVAVNISDEGSLGFIDGKSTLQAKDYKEKNI